MSYVTQANAVLTPEFRLKLVRLVLEDGWTRARVAERLQVSRATVSRWVARFRAQGLSGLTDRSSRPKQSPMRTAQHTDRRIIALRFIRRCGPHRIGYHLGRPQSTVSKVLNRYHMPLLGHLDMNTGLPIRKPAPVRHKTRPAGRARACRCEETGQNPRRRRAPDSGHGRYQEQEEAGAHRLLHPAFGHR